MVRVGSAPWVIDPQPPSGPGAISWDGAGEHTGHMVSVLESWNARLNQRVEVVTDGGEVAIANLNWFSVGSVRCTCGKSWEVGGWPKGVWDKIMEAGDE